MSSKRMRTFPESRKSFWANYQRRQLREAPINRILTCGNGTCGKVATKVLTGPAGFTYIRCDPHAEVVQGYYRQLVGEKKTLIVSSIEEYVILLAEARLEQ